MSKLKGMGGHMTAALIHEIDVLYRVYDAKIAGAWVHNDERTAQSLANSRDEKIRKIQAQLSERGYQYVMRDRPAASLKPAWAEVPKELERAVQMHVARQRMLKSMGLAA